MESVETRTLSPGDLAEIVGVSESSIRRWVDAGRIDVMRTAGGHRRIPLRSALRYVRENDLQILRPDLLGMPGLTARAAHEELTADALFDLLQAGDAAAVRGAVAGAFLHGMPLSELYDGPVAGALQRLGELWRHGEEGIFVEHVATSICIEAVNEIRLLLPPPVDGAPVALGGAVAADPYILPSLMAA
ncbi:MAG: helix-turn-helix domain-containing protein, partial [Rhodothermales bacterium]